MSRWQGLPRTKRTHHASQSEVDVVLGIRSGKVPGGLVTVREDGMVEVSGNGKWFLMPQSRYDEIVNHRPSHGIQINNDY